MLSVGGAHKKDVSPLFVKPACHRLLGFSSASAPMA